MNVTLLDAADVRRELRRLLKAHKEVHWAVAWGSNADQWSSLIAQKSKFRNVVFGLAFAQTDPDLVAELQEVRHAYVVKRYPGGTFHPKIYAFRTKDRAAAIIGSANFTSGGLSKNFEAATLFEGDAEAPFFRSVFKMVAQAASFGVKVTPGIVADYRVQVSIAKSMPKAPRDPLPNLRPKAEVTLGFIDRDWSVYLNQLNSVRPEDVIARLEMLDAARKIFAVQPDFNRLDQLQRKALAGIVGKKERLGLDYSGDWGWFGSMTGFGDLRGLIRTNDKLLAQAIDSIPLQGEVTEADYRRFVDLFEKAFRATSRKGGVATASRFLAIKRPESFLCVCDPNERAAGKDLGFAYTSLDLDNYWDRVVAPIRASSWYQSSRPVDESQARIWDARAAMLDAVYYA